MKRLALGLAVSIVAGALGCTGQTAATGEGGSSAQSVSAGSVSAAKVAADAEPAEAVVERFLKALQAGDSATAESLLTEKSRKETAANDWKVQPPGSPDAKYTIVESLVRDGETYVSSDWSEPVSETESATYNIVWIAKPDNGQWRISGMITQFGADQDLMLSFEDVEGMIKTIQEAETALAQAAQSAAATGQTASATGPTATGTAPESATGAGLGGSLEFDSTTPASAGAAVEGSLR